MTSRWTALVTALVWAAGLGLGVAVWATIVWWLTR